MGQSSSRQQVPAADSQPRRHPSQRRRLRTRPNSTLFDTPTFRRRNAPHGGDGSDPGPTDDTTPSQRRPRSVHIPDILTRPWAERQQLRSRSPSRRNRHSLRQGHSLRAPAFARRIFTHRRDEDEDVADVGQSWTLEPRDSLDMAHAARNRSPPRLPEVTPDTRNQGLNSDSSHTAEHDTNLEPPPPRSSVREGWTPLHDSRELRSSPRLSNRLSSLTPARDLSRLTSTIRRRHTRHSTPAEQNAAMLQRLLSVAAAATAASLMGGNPEAAVNDLRRTAVNVEEDDGSFDNFLQALRNGRLASHLGRNNNNNTNGDSANGGEGEGQSNHNSLDFFRMFRFGPHGGAAGSRNSAPAATSLGRSNNSNGGNPNQDTSGVQQNNSQSDDPEARTVSILIVGIRSLNNQDAENPDGPEREQDMPSFIDALANLNTTINVGLQDQGSNVPVGTPRNSTALSRNRRASMGGLFAGRERTRRARGSSSGRPLSEIGPSSSVMPDLIENPRQPDDGTADNLHNTPLPEEEASQPEPVSEGATQSSVPEPAALPPSATNGRARESGRNSWRQSWRQSWRDSWHSAVGDHRRSIVDPTEDGDERPQPRWSRRRSASEALRFGSGSSRRNGVVEPDEPSPDGEPHRSWIIYVLGGSYPENHPILTTPSLFTENPTYEDMLLLSSLIGPSKPPVAQSEDVQASGGLFRVDPGAHGFVARAVHEDGDDGFIETINLDLLQNCQICLSSYNDQEMTRRLHECKHLFHQECIDQWLTTGRNSCPLCRTRGVLEKTPPPDANIQMPGDPGSSREAAAAALTSGRM